MPDGLPPPSRTLSIGMMSLSVQEPAVRHGCEFFECALSGGGKAADSLPGGADGANAGEREPSRPVGTGGRSGLPRVGQTLSRQTASQPEVRDRPPPSLVSSCVYRLYQIKTTAIAKNQTAGGRLHSRACAAIPTLVFVVRNAFGDPVRLVAQHRHLHDPSSRHPAATATVEDWNDMDRAVVQDYSGRSRAAARAQHARPVGSITGPASIWWSLSKMFSVVTQRYRSFI
jgi:hypothetical protein